MEWNSNLNQAQREVVEYNKGPMMILAGAGSGKTRTLVSKLLHLIKNDGIPPSKVLALTFSNKAAQEMRDRVESVLQTGPFYLQVQTFHSFAARILRNEATYLGLSKTFTIYDGSESKAVAKNVLGKFGITSKEINPYDVLSYIENLKNSGHYAGRSDSKNYDSDEFYKFFVEYEKEILNSNALDFGGLLTATLNLFETHENLRESYEKRYDIILVDEYQDTNSAQFQLLTHLRKNNKLICVVGDEDQSIYSWRGANINNILDFDKHFKGAKIFKLEQNYRSTKHIIEAASQVISHNEERKGKKLWTENVEGDKIEIIEIANEREEAEIVANKIKKLIERENIPVSDIAIFYRTNAQSRLLEESLRKVKIEYRVVGGVKFYDRKEIKDLISYMRLVTNPKDSLAFGRIINVPARGIGATSLKKLELNAIDLGLSLYETAMRMIGSSQIENELRLSKKLISALQNFISMIEECNALSSIGSGPVKIFQKLLYDSGYWDHLKATRDYESMSRMENIQEFESAIIHYEKTNEGATLSGFLETITLNSQVEEIDENKKNELQVSLMTIHGAKGLEFPYAFIVGAEEQVFPSFRSLEDGAHGVEEERRLFYVAMTRAMKKLTITFAQGRTVFGLFRLNGPSRFLHEIPKSHATWLALVPDQRTDDYCLNNFDSTTNYSNNKNDNQEFFQESYDDESYVSGSRKLDGQKVLHKIYGQGVIVDSTGVGNEAKITIRFKDGVKKKFLMKYSPIEFLGQ